MFAASVILKSDDDVRMLQAPAPEVLADEAQLKSLLNQNFGTQLLFSGNSPDIISTLNNGYSIRFSADSNPLEANEFNDPEFKLFKAYPNPFNPSLTINYSLAKPSNVKIDIYDIKGTFIETILNKRLSAGSYANFWVPKSLASGTYIINLNINQKSYSEKVILLK